MQQALESHNHADFIAALKEAKVFNNAGGTLRRRLAELMNQDREKFRAIFERIEALPAAEQLRLVEGEEVQHIFSLLKAYRKKILTKNDMINPDEEDPAVVGAIVVAVAAALVVAYVSVVVAVSVELMIGIHLSVVASTAVVGIDSAKAKNLRAEAARLAQLDPELLSDARRAVRIAALGRSNEMVKQTNAWLVEKEIEAVVGAARETGLINIPPEVETKITRSLQQMALRIAGLAPVTA